MEFVDSTEKHIPMGQWFIDIVIHLQFVMEKTVSTAESQQYEVHEAKVRKMNDKSIVISDF